MSRLDTDATDLVRPGPAGQAEHVGGRLRLAELRLTGDPLADAVAADRVPRGVIDDALHQGTLDGPPSLMALRTELEEWPHWIRPERMARGSRAYLGIGSTWMQLLLGPGSLVNTYRSPSIAAVLAATGRLDSAAAGRRIQETGLWLGSAVLPDALLVGAPGYVATAQVRLLHAGVRRQLGKRGWDVDRWGVPVNQTDLARTLLDFTYVPIKAMHRLGVGFTVDERDDIYHLFRHIGHLLGLHPDLHFDNHEQATQLVELLAEVSGPPGEASRALVEALLQAYDELLSPVLHTPVPITHQLVLALARVFHGRAVGQTVGLAAPAPWASATVRALGVANSAVRLLGRAVPAVRDRVIDQTVTAIGGFAETLESTPLYQDPTVSAEVGARSDLRRAR
jgi:hypothetical protein